MNAACQLKDAVSQGTVRIATIGPTFVPALKMPVASARSFLGNHSATVLMQAGKLADSPSPRNARATPKVNAERAAAVATAARLQRVTEMEYPFRVPSLSIM